MHHLPAMILLILISGCITTSAPPLVARTTATPPEGAVAQFDGRTGAAITWGEVLNRSLAADVVLIGELHDHAAGHAVQEAYLQDYWRSGRAALCTEMIDRTEQPFVDAYLQGQLDAPTFIAITQSADIGGKGNWIEYYQPLIDAAKEAGQPVVAANTPRAFTTIARMQGFDALASFKKAYPNQFVLPEAIEQDAYFDRFKETMARHGHGDSNALPDEQLEGFFRAQQVWDATMADATLDAARKHGKAILIVGQFHVDREGGLLLRLRQRAPKLNVLTINLIKCADSALREEDKDRADCIVYVRDDPPAEEKP